MIGDENMETSGAAYRLFAFEISTVMSPCCLIWERGVRFHYRVLYFLSPACRPCDCLAHP